MSGPWRDWPSDLPAPVQTLADLIAEVAAEHVDYHGGCQACAETQGPWPCDAARLAAALSVENVAAGLRYCFPGLHLDTEIAAALLAAITVPE